MCYFMLSQVASEEANACYAGPLAPPSYCAYISII